MKKLALLFLLTVFIIIPIVAQTTEISPELEDQLTSIENYVSENRGLAILEPVSKRFITREELRALMTEQTQTSTSDAGLSQRELLYRVLGFISDVNVFYEASVNSLSQSISGFYETSLARITVILPEGELAGDILPLIPQIAYAHEFVHALQQQHFDLFEGNVFDTVDQYMAYRALVEGDAIVAMRAYSAYAIQNNLGDMNSQPLSQDALQAINNTPPIVASEMNFTYNTGANFVIYLRSHAGNSWDAINDVYANLPQSSEQILQPAKYLAGELPIPVELEDISGVLGDDWQHIETNTVGQLYLSEYLSVHIARGIAYQVMNGWGGDTMSIYQQPDTDEWAWALGITWDAPIEKEQREFSDLYTQIFEMAFDIVSETPLCGVLDGMTTCFANTATTTFITSAPTTDLAQALLTRVTEE